MEQFKEGKPRTSSRSPSPENKYSNTSKEEFEKLIMLDREKTRFKIVYFILNTLSHLVNSSQWYCYCQRTDCCQICKILSMFSDFEKIIDKNMFNMELLNSYYYQLTKQLFKLFDKKKDCIEFFQGEYPNGHIFVDSPSIRPRNSTWKVHENYIESTWKL